MLCLIYFKYNLLSTAVMACWSFRLCNPINSHRYICDKARNAILSGLASVIGVQVLVAAAGSLIGIVYARYKWVGVLMIALLSGGTAGIFSFLVASRGRDGIALIAGFLSPEGPWLLIAAAVLAAVEIAAAWLHFRRREVKL